MFLQRSPLGEDGMDRGPSPHQEFHGPRGVLLRLDGKEDLVPPLNGWPQAPLLDMDPGGLIEAGSDDLDTLDFTP